MTKWILVLSSLLLVGFGQNTLAAENPVFQFKGHYKVIKAECVPSDLWCSDDKITIGKKSNDLDGNTAEIQLAWNGVVTTLWIRNEDNENYFATVEAINDGFEFNSRSRRTQSLWTITLKPIADNLWLYRDSYISAENNFSTEYTLEKE